jgi:hypothetical protein
VNYDEVKEAEHSWLTAQPKTFFSDDKEVGATV